MYNLSRLNAALLKKVDAKIRSRSIDGKLAREATLKIAKRYVSRNTDEEFQRAEQVYDESELVAGK